jgi:hypothetical protein
MGDETDAVRNCAEFGQTVEAALTGLAEYQGKPHRVCTADARQNAPKLELVRAFEHRPTRFGVAQVENVLQRSRRQIGDVGADPRHQRHIGAAVRMGQQDCIAPRIANQRTDLLECGLQIFRARQRRQIENGIGRGRCAGKRHSLHAARRRPAK